jgi:hypothetical protein
MNKKIFEKIFDNKNLKNEKIIINYETNEIIENIIIYED